MQERVEFQDNLPVETTEPAHGHMCYKQSCWWTHRDEHCEEEMLLNCPEHREGWQQ